MAKSLVSLALGSPVPGDGINPCEGWAVPALSQYPHQPQTNEAAGTMAAPSPCSPRHPPCMREAGIHGPGWGGVTWGWGGVTWGIGVWVASEQADGPYWWSQDLSDFSNVTFADRTTEWANWKAEETTSFGHFIMII